MGGMRCSRQEGEQGVLGGGRCLICRNGDSGVALSLSATPERRLQPLGVRPLPPGNQRQYERTQSQAAPEEVYAGH